MGARLFSACPVPESVATELHAWAAETLDADSARLVPPENYHVTLVFYGQVNAERQAELERLTEQMAWEPVAVRSDKAKVFGRSAIGVGLKTAPFEIPRLDCRLDRLAILRHKAELQNRRSLNLHLTIARIKKPMSIPVDLGQPSIAFVLDPLVLYASIPGGGQARYERITQSGSADSDKLGPWTHL